MRLFMSYCASSYACIGVREIKGVLASLGAAAGYVRAPHLASSRDDDGGRRRAGERIESIRVFLCAARVIAHRGSVTTDDGRARREAWLGILSTPAAVGARGYLSRRASRRARWTHTRSGETREG